MSSENLFITSQDTGQVTTTISWYLKMLTFKPMSGELELFQQSLQSPENGMKRWALNELSSSLPTHSSASDLILGLPQASKGVRVNSAGPRGRRRKDPAHTKAIQPERTFLWLSPQCMSIATMISCGSGFLCRPEWSARPFKCSNFFC